MTTGQAKLDQIKITEFKDQIQFGFSLIPEIERFNQLETPCMNVQSLSSVQLFATPWTVAGQAPLCMEFSRQEYWSGMPFPPSGDVCAKSLQSCSALCNPMDCSLPGSSVLGILQAGILEWVAIPFSRGFFPPRDRTWVSWIAGRLFTI